RGAEAERLRRPRSSAPMRREPATAKLNLALIVGRPREDGKHEVATVYQRLDLADRVALSPASRLRVVGFAPDTLVLRALERPADAAGAAPSLGARMTQPNPVPSRLTRR